jgi:hypothetical protein
VSDLFELSFRWQDGAVQVIIYALVIYLGLVIISKITDKREKRGLDQEMTNEDTIISCLSNDLFVEPNLIVEEIMTASNLKASLRLAVEDFANYPMLLEKLASKF